LAYSFILLEINILAANDETSALHSAASTEKPQDQNTINRKHWKYLSKNKSAMNMHNLTRSFTVLFLLISSTLFSQYATIEEISEKKKRGQLEGYIMESGDNLRIGDELKLLSPEGDNSNYTFVQQNAGLSLHPLPSSIAHTDVEIKKIKAQSKTLFVYTYKPDGMVYGLIIRNLPAAITQKEVKIPGTMTQDEAIAKLKKQKELWDLGVITEEEYEAEKAKLMKYLK
jgi:hypothetical protein